MSLFTVIVDYDGGTYIGQVEADDANQAALAWATQLEVRDIPGMGNKSKEALKTDLKVKQTDGYGPTFLDGLVNVWCESSLVRGKLILIHIVQTSS